MCVLIDVMYFGGSKNVIRPTFGDLQEMKQM